MNTSKGKSFVALSVLALMATNLYADPTPTATQTTVQTTIQQTPPSMQCSQQQMALSMAMRELWIEHIAYTRNYIISALANIGDKDVVAKRLLKNQDDIGAAMGTYYGTDAGKLLSSLLREHVLISADVIKAAKTKKKSDLEKAQQKWMDNADQIAVFLSTANPNWNKNDLIDMLHKHLELTTGEVKSRISKNWQADIDYFDQVTSEMLRMADALTAGIVKQFPEKFS